MKKILSSILVASFTLSVVGCGVQPMQAPKRALAPKAASQLRALSADKEAPIVERKAPKNTPTTEFDKVGEKTKGKTEFPADKAFSAPEKAEESTRGRHHNPWDDDDYYDLPFRSFSAFYDHVRYNYKNNKYMSRRTAQHHFRQNVNAYRTVKRFYKPSHSQLKRFMLVDMLANSLRVDGRTLPYTNTHNPPSQAHYKYLPTEAAEYMPTFGEMVDYNRTSYQVPYERWRMYRAARYYQANYARLFQMIMEYGPTKREAKKLIHREITDYAGY